MTDDPNKAPDDGDDLDARISRLLDARLNSALASRDKRLQAAIGKTLEEQLAKLAPAAADKPADEPAEGASRRLVQAVLPWGFARASFKVTDTALAAAHANRNPTDLGAWGKPPAPSRMRIRFSHQNTRGTRFAASATVTRSFGRARKGAQWIGLCDAHGDGPYALTASESRGAQRTGSG